MKKLILVTLISGYLVGCSGDKASMATVEEQRTIARDNSMLVAKKFRTENPQYQGFKIIPNGDSTMKRTCPQGDGWASLKLINEKNQIVKIKCSTYSMGIGCIESSEFSKKSYAAEDGRCNYDLDYPLPKIMQ